MTIWGLDVSNHKPWNFDFPQAVREGFTFCLTKATEGIGYTDRNWFNSGSAKGYAVRIPESGLVPGAYHFLRAGDGAAQARYFLSRVRSAGGPAGWICSCDCEADASWNTLYAFYDTWLWETGGHVLPLYTGAWWWNSHGWDARKLPGGLPPLWLSRYIGGSGPASVLYQSVPTGWWYAGFGGWGSAEILQFSSSGVVAGTSAIDVNAFEGTIDRLRALAEGVDDSSVTSPSGGTTMGLSVADQDPYGEGPDGQTRSQAAMLRDLYYGVALGYGVPGATADAPTTALHDIKTSLAELAAGQVTPMTGEQYQQFVELMRADFRAAVASQVKQSIDPLVQALGAYGDRLAEAAQQLGVLNDESATGA